MKIIITESQKSIILSENIGLGINNKLKDMKIFTKNVLNSTKNQTGLDLKFLLTWGSTIGGFMGPIARYMEDKSPSLTDADIALISTGIILTYYNENKEKLIKVLDKIEERKLISEFDDALSIANILKNKFLNFIESLGVTISSIGNMMAYTFLIPLLPEIYSLVQDTGKNVDVNMMVERIMNYGIVTASAIFVKELVIKIVERFRS
tara:strand:+ start:1093 stop:1713 length:621 start_codon:yes stop_codon:yes gene_type:complete